MSWTRFAIRRPIAMLMILAALCLLGGVSYSQLAVKRLPNVSYPKVSVSVSYPGSGADNVRTEVLDPIQNALSTIGGIDNMQATATNGHGRLSIRFESGLDMNEKAAEVAHAIDAMSGTLPAELPTPSVTKADPDAAPILSVAVTGDGSRSDLYNWATETLQPAIARIPGVASVTLTGAREPQIHLDANPSKLLQYGVTLGDIVQALGTGGTAIPGGATQSGLLELPVVTQGTIDGPTDYSNVIISHNPAGKDVRLGQVADVRLGYAPIETESKWNGNPAMSAYVFAQSTANNLEVSNGVRRALDTLRQSAPAGTDIRLLGDLTSFTRHALTSVETDLFVAILAAGIVLALFLRRWRQTLIVMLAIPTSLLLTGIIMYALHFSLDVISLLAMSLLIGILIDDAIVVLENIDRHRKMGKPALEAAIDGRAEIGWAAIAITLTDVVVYAPVAFLSGNVGQLLREFGLIIATASLFSLVVSFTLTPLMAAYGLKDRTVLEDRQAMGSVNKAATFVRSDLMILPYGKMQTYFIRHWYWPLLFLCLCGWLIWGAFLRGWLTTTFVPDENAGVFAVQVQLPDGTAQSVTDQAVDRLTSAIRELPSVDGVLSTTGFGNGAADGSNRGQLTIELKSDAGLNGTMRAAGQVSQMAKTIPGMKVQTSTANPLLTEAGGTVHAVLRGTDRATLEQLAGNLQELFQLTPGLSNVQSTAEPNAPQWSILPNDHAISLYGLNAQLVGQAIRTAVQGRTVGSFIPRGSLQGQSVILQLAGGGSLSPEQMRNVPIARYGGRLVTLGQVAVIEKGTAPQKVLEYDRQLQVSVTANASDSDVGAIAKALQQKVAKLGMPAGYSFKLTGSVEQKSKAFKPMLSALLLSVLLMYMLLASLYESLLDPLLVILTLPFAAAGGVLALWLTDTPFSLYAFIAMIMLMGLVAKNAILLIDYARFYRNRGDDVLEALLRASRVRLRPIVMTTVTMVFAMVPLALPYGTGAADRMPIALVLIGGMSLSTVLTLLVLPTGCVYAWQLQNTVQSFIRRKWPNRHAAASFEQSESK